ncbi:MULTISPECIES: GlxA family transcriptional regulator [unclassified Pseudomonas]|uniref:GlxA family transcriptional regulator n=1 Tax=unclassified Pseudomonas TaxID=196821 RepID=UPI0025F03703|nr:MULTISPECIES: helix-turn-helix domain-containing protein [unclassified Pseudomonas]
MNAQRPVAEIGLLIYPGAQSAAVHGLTDLFEVANHMADEQASVRLPRLAVSHWHVDNGSEPQRTYQSVAGEPHAALAAVVIPPSLKGLPGTETMEGLSRWVLAQHAAGATIGTVCLGAFVLAQTGLLNGRAATTHWTRAKPLAERFPTIRVNADQPIIDDGDIITTAGLMAWSALGLRLVERLLGPSIAARTARFLVIEHSESAQRCGRNFAPILAHGDVAVLRVQHWLQSIGAVDVSIARMALRAGLEERTFLRRFRAATGLKPTEYCQHLRVGKAREMLELTHSTIDHIAWTVGYRDPASFRLTFRKITGLALSEYRHTFGFAGSAMPPCD